MIRPTRIERIEDYINLIQFEARKCWAKLKIPKIHEVEDLEQEGKMCWYRTLREYRKKAENRPFRPFFRASLINHLNCILIESYRSPTPNSELIQIRVQATFSNPFELASTIETIKKLGEAELIYLTLLLNPTKTIQQQFVSQPRRKFCIPRENLNIPYVDELRVRRNLIGILV